MIPWWAKASTCMIKTQAEAMVEAAKKATPADRTMAAQVDSWKNLLRAACQSGPMSEGCYDAYCRKIRPFAEWIGPQSAIDAIDEAKLEGSSTTYRSRSRLGAIPPLPPTNCS